MRGIGAYVKQILQAWQYDADTVYPMLSADTGRYLIDEFSGDAGQHTDIIRGFTGYGLMQYAIVRNARPRRILCIGSRRGFIPAILALAVRDNGHGHVDFVDPGYSMSSHPGISWGGVGFWKQHNPADHFSKLGIQSYITTYPVTSAQYAKHSGKSTYDYVYIDGDHSYEGVKHDFRTFWPKLSRGGFFVFHDISAKGKLEGGTFGVRKLWKELNLPGKIQFPWPSESGLGIIQKG